MMPAENQTTGQNIGFPDVCTTPAAPSPVPIPYPNIGSQAMSTVMCPTILVTMTPGHTMMSKPAMTNGDNAGVAHATVMAPGATTMGNPKILLQGQPAGSLCVPTTGNNYNNPLGAQIVPSVTTVLYTYTPNGLVPHVGAGFTPAREPGGDKPLPYIPTSGVAEALNADLNDPAPGLGISTTPAAGGGLRVTHVRGDGLADRLGVRAGDVLLAVAGEPLRADAPLPRFRAGETVRVDLARDGELLSVEGVQTHVPAALDGELVDARGVIRVRRFDARTGERVSATVDALLALGAQELELDLRGCPGGALDQAVAVAGLFLPAGTLVATVETEGERALYLTADAPRASLPLTVHVDGQTASAAEVLAASLQDHGRARIVGQTTFGKGVGVEVSAEGVSTARLYRPTGASLDAGVLPA